MHELARVPQIPDIGAYVEAARQLREQDGCPTHGEKSATTCQECLADRQLAGPDSRLRWARTLAMGACDERFPQRFIDAVPDQAAVRAWLQEYALDPRTAPSLLMYGATGTGKTHQAYAALRAAILIRPAIAWAASTFPDFAAALRPRPGVDSEAEMERYRDADLLLLDDVGMAKHSEWVEEITYRLVNSRYEAMRPTIITTNLSMAELRDRLGDRVAGRLREQSTIVLLQAQDWRRRAA